MNVYQAQSVASDESLIGGPNLGPLNLMNAPYLEYTTP